MLHEVGLVDLITLDHLGPPPAIVQEEVWKAAENNEAWIERLLRAIESDPRSMRRVALDAGLSVNFVSQFKSGDRVSTTVGNLLKLCETLTVSPIYILTGAQLSPELDRLIEVWGKADKDQRSALLTLLERFSAPTGGPLL